MSAKILEFPSNGVSQKDYIVAEKICDVEFCVTAEEYARSRDIAYSILCDIKKLKDIDDKVERMGDLLLYYKNNW